MSYLPNLEGAPGWFLDVIKDLPEPRRTTTSDGINIHYECWNPADTHKPPLLFLHGFLAHSRAWDTVAPFFRDQFQVFVMDWAGMGESDYRASYHPDTYDLDLLAVVDAISDGPVTLIGHSFGGTRVVPFCGWHPEKVRHAVVVDSFMIFKDLPVPPFGRMSSGRTPYYPEYDTIVSRYRLVPPQPVEPWMLQYMAHHSVRQTEDGWTWKFDAEVTSKGSMEDGAEVLSAVKVPIDIVFGELSAMKDDERVRRMLSLPAQARGPVIIPQAHHHIMLDQPLALVSALRVLLDHDH